MLFLVVSRNIVVLGWNRICSLSYSDDHLISTKRCIHTLRERERLFLYLCSQGLPTSNKEVVPTDSKQQILTSRCNMKNNIYVYASMIHRLCMIHVTVKFKWYLYRSWSTVEECVREDKRSNYAVVKDAWIILRNGWMSVQRAYGAKSFGAAVNDAIASQASPTRGFWDVLASLGLMGHSMWQHNLCHATQEFKNQISKILCQPCQCWRSCHSRHKITLHSSNN